MHQQNNYPSPKAVSDLDIGLADGTGDDEFLSRLDAAMPRVWETKPDIVFYVAGADPFAEDRLGGLLLTRDGLEARDRRVLEDAAARGVPFVVTLGGGYARTAADTASIHTRTCLAALDAVASAMGGA
jgi:acetoin utilization deacetylase AcuC-like enzyme